MEDFFLNIIYKNKKVKFRIVNPNAPLSTLMSNLRHAIGKDGRLVFDFPSIDETGAPLDYFFGKEDSEVKNCSLLNKYLLLLLIQIRRQRDLQTHS